MSRAPTALPEIAGLPAGLAVLVAGRGGTRPGRPPPAFAAVALPRRRWAATAGQVKYCVLRAPGDEVWVDAECAIEAIGKSGVERPYLVRRGDEPRAVAATVIADDRLVPADDADETGEADEAPGAAADPVEAADAPGAADEPAEAAADAPAADRPADGGEDAPPG